MGRAIDQDNRLEDHERRLKLVEGAIEELLHNGTTVHHVDLHNEINKHEERIKAENHGTVLEPDEEFTPPAGTRKKITRKTKATATT